MRPRFHPVFLTLARSKRSSCPCPHSSSSHVKSSTNRCFIAFSVGIRPDQPLLDDDDIVAPVDVPGLLNAPLHDDSEGSLDAEDDNDDEHPDSYQEDANDSDGYSTDADAPAPSGDPDTDPSGLLPSGNLGVPRLDLSAI